MQLHDIPGIGDKTLAALANSGLNSLNDLLRTYPRTYRTYQTATIRSARPGDWVILQGTLTKLSSHYKGSLSIQNATLSDETGSLTLRWFNMPYLARTLSLHVQYQVLGRVEEFGGRLQLVAPQVRKSLDVQQHGSVLVPIYRQLGSLKPWILRDKIKSVLAHITPLTDPLPAKIVERYNLLAYHEAITLIHQPLSEKDLERAVHRLAWQELYELQLAATNTAGENQKFRAEGLHYNPQQVQHFIDHLPFKLTSSQLSAVTTILSDLTKPWRMTRLLQGEVGSGKTIVAVILAYAAATAGYKTLVMAPTEILATQLFASFTKFLSPLGLEISLILGRHKSAGQGQIIVGTQALLNKSWSNVALVIIDEQQRFGVKDREGLLQGKVAPHYLMMTATPIPRTLAMTHLANLSLTRLTSLPKGRLPIKTYLVKESKRLSAYTWIDQQIARGNRVFVVTPLIEAAEDLDLSPLKSIAECERTLSLHFPSRRLAVLHSRLQSSAKRDTFSRFQNGEIDILVATSMIEVGLDVPEANIIVIENAERFGLAQLHQLRGRVGRGGLEGHCLLFTSSTSPKVEERLAYFLRHTDGAKLAEFDLVSRGAGNLFGNAQHGFFNLKLASLFDERLLQETREAVKIA